MMVNWEDKEPTARDLAKPTFSPPQGDSRANLAAFIAQGRLVAARKGIDFETDLWEVSGMLPPRSGPVASPGRRHLCFAEDRGRGRVGKPLPICVKDLAKAYCAHFLGSMQLTGLKDRHDAMRFLGVALEYAPIDCVTIAVLDSAMTALREYYVPNAVRNRGVQLELISEFLDESGIALADLSGWSHGCPSPLPKGGRDGSGSDASATCLPTPAFLDALTTSFARAVRPHHVLISGGCTVMRSVPSRVGQILKLTEEAAGLFEEDGHRRMRILVPGAKGGPPTVKLVDKDMTPIVGLAFNRMRNASAEPRAMKRHYRDHRDTLYLPPDLEHLRGHELARDQASLLLGINPGYLVEYASKHDLDVPHFPASQSVRFEVIERHILSQLDRLELAAGGRDYNPLMLIKWRSLSTQGSPCMFEPLVYSTFNRALKPRSGCVGMFPQLGVERPENATGVTHSLRRELVTKGVRGGLAQDDLCQWCVVPDARWIPFYDYTTDADFRDAVTGVAEILLEDIAEDLDI